MFPVRKRAYSTATDEQFHKNNLSSPLSSSPSALSDISEKKDTSENKHQHLVDVSNGFKSSQVHYRNSKKNRPLRLKMYHYIES